MADDDIRTAIMSVSRMIGNAGIPDEVRSRWMEVLKHLMKADEAVPRAQVFENCRFYTKDGPNG